MLPDEIISMVTRQFPEAKVIFLARDPVERAWSQISMSVRTGGSHSTSKIPLKLFVNYCIRLLCSGRIPA